MQKLKVILLSVSILVLLLCLGLSEQQLNILFKHSSYFIVGILFFLWILRLVGVYGKKCRQGLKLHWPALLMAFIFVISPPKFTHSS